MVLPEKTPAFNSPSSNTGVTNAKTQIALSIGWLQFTFRCHLPGEWSTYLQILDETLESFFPFAILRERGSGFQGYRRSALSEGGLRYAFTEGRPDIHVVIPQTFLDSLTPDRLWKLFQFVDGLPGVTISRIDLSLDDFSKDVRPIDVWNCVNGGNYVGFSRAGDTGLPVQEWIQSVNARGELSTTYYVGSRQSDVLMRVYDKDAESQGAVDAVRFELRLRHQSADFAFRKLVEFTPFYWDRAVPALVLGHFDLREKESASHIEHRERVTWWERIVGAGVKPLRGVKKMCDSLIGNKIKWLHKQVYPTLRQLAELYECSIPDLLDSIKRHSPSLPAWFKKAPSELPGISELISSLYPDKFDSEAVSGWMSKLDELLPSDNCGQGGAQRVTGYQSEFEFVPSV